VCAVYTDDLPQTEPMRRLREKYPFCALVQHEPLRSASVEERSYSERLRAAATDEERIDAFLAHVRNGAGATPREQELIREVLDDRTLAEALV